MKQIKIIYEDKNMRDFIKDPETGRITSPTIRKVITKPECSSKVTCREGGVEGGGSGFRKYIEELQQPTFDVLVKDEEEYNKSLESAKEVEEMLNWLDNYNHGEERKKTKRRIISERASFLHDEDVKKNNPVNSDEYYWLEAERDVEAQLERTNPKITPFEVAKKQGELLKKHDSMWKGDPIETLKEALDENKRRLADPSIFSRLKKAVKMVWRGY